jgi:CDP-6-deoxy-D-xylo-4-hexulose-3-dehydrase
MEFQTALASIQIKKAEEIIRSRYDNVQYLNEGLASIEDKVTLPKLDVKVSYLAYPLVLADGIDRASVLKELEKEGVEARPLFGCIPTQQPSYRRYKKKYQGRLPVAERLGSQGLYVGCHQYLTEDDLDHVIKVFKEVLT